jgi:hypothetical protein
MKKPSAKEGFFNKGQKGGLSELASNGHPGIEKKIK